MIGVVTALFSEATLIIDRLGLKRVKKSPFLIFQNNDTILIISGVGYLNGCSATTFLLANYPISQLFNIGIAGTSTDLYSISKLYIINKIIDTITNRVIFIKDLNYPNLAHLKTSPIPITEVKNGDKYLFDMEGFAIYSCAKRFKIKPIFIKIVSDKLNPKIITKEYILNLFQLNIDKILTIIKG